MENRQPPYPLLEGDFYPESELFEGWAVKRENAFDVDAHAGQWNTWFLYGEDSGHTEESIQEQKNRQGIKDYQERSRLYPFNQAQKSERRRRMRRIARFAWTAVKVIVTLIMLGAFGWYLGLGLKGR